MSDFTTGAHECFCDRQYKDANKLETCGDCPRDYIAGAWDARRKYIHEERNMENKHTPGPWNVAECRYGFAVYASKTGDAVVKTEDVEGRYGAIDNEADARLIAAAPELLEALTEIVSAADGDGWKQLDATFATARSAIAKATRGKGEP